MYSILPGQRSQYFFGKVRIHTRQRLLPYQSFRLTCKTLHTKIKSQPSLGPANIYLIFILEQSGRIFASKEEAKNFCILFWRGVLLFTVVECRLNANMLYYKICLCLPFSALSLCILLPYVLLICIILRSSQYFRESVSINHSFRHQ